MSAADVWQRLAKPVFICACVFKNISLPVSMISSQLPSEFMVLLTVVDDQSLLVRPLKAADPKTGSAAVSESRVDGISRFFRGSPLQQDPYSDKLAVTADIHGCFSGRVFPRIFLPCACTVSASVRISDLVFCFCFFFSAFSDNFAFGH